jgi:predicted transcriptional regulator
MKRTTTSIDDAVMQRLRVIATERRISVAALVREALGEKVRDHRPRARGIGTGSLQ